MTAATVLGESSLPLVVKLTDLGGFNATMRISETSTLTEWPAGTEVDLRLEHRGVVLTWPAVVEGRTIRWMVPNSGTRLVPEGADARILVRIPGIPEIEWYDGAVVRP